MSVAQDEQVKALSSVDRDRTKGDIRLVLMIAAVLDLMMVIIATIIAWDLRVAFDVFTMGALAGSDIIRHSVPWILAVWFVMLAAQGAYSSRYFGAGPDEFRSVATASVTAGGLVSIVCYLLQLPLSRGFLLLTFVIGTPLLLLERYALRKIVHRMRRNGRLLHRVIAVGGASGISEVVEALRREQYVGYAVVGACVPAGVAVQPEQIAVPVLGAVAETRRLCDEVGADTVLVARGGYATSRELRRIAWDLEGSDIELIVVPSLTDVAGPRIHMRPVAGLPLLHVEQPQAGEAGGLAKRVFDIVVSIAALVLLSPLLLVVALAVKAQDGGPVFFRQARIGRKAEPFGM